MLFSLVTAPGPEEVLTMDEVADVHRRLSAALTFAPLVYAPDPGGTNRLARNAAESWTDPPFDVFLGTLPFDQDETWFVRGDVQADGRIDISDAIFGLRYLFLGGDRPSCLKTVDVDDNGRINVGDATRLLVHLFHQARIMPPSPLCGPDPTSDELSCLEFSDCD